MRHIVVTLVAAALSLAPAAGADRPMRVVFPEGWSIREMIDRVSAVRLIAIRTDHVTPVLTGAGYAKAAASARPPSAFASLDKRHSLEGFLFPSTYFFDATTRPSQIVAEQIRTFEARWASLTLSSRAEQIGPYGILTVASLVEREAAVPAERKLIAAVIYNRLAAGMPLGIDATLRYGLGIQGTRPLTATEIHSSNPYNTDIYSGLPPTPITNPGLASLRAAADPAPIAALYYIRLPDSNHHFFTASESVFCQKLIEWGYHPC